MKSVWSSSLILLTNGGFFSMHSDCLAITNLLVLQCSGPLNRRPLQQRSEQFTIHKKWISFGRITDHVTTAQCGSVYGSFSTLNVRKRFVSLVRAADAAPNINATCGERTVDSSTCRRWLSTFHSEGASLVDAHRSGQPVEFESRKPCNHSSM